MSTKFVKIVPGFFANETRDLREIKCVHEMTNSDVIVVAKGEKNNILQFGFYELHTRTTRPVRFLPGVINRFIAFFSWIIYVKSLKADVISAHDIIALGIAYLSSVFSFRTTKLVYDSHEFEIGRNSKRSRLSTFLIKHVEKFLMKKCVFSIMVNDTIADQVQQIHKLKKRPIVVRSVQPYIEIDTQVTKKQRELFNRQFGFQPDDFIVMYHGAITNGRGIENIIKSIKNTSGVKCVILGFGENNYISNLKNMILDLGLQTKVFFHEAVPSDELWKFVGAVDTGLVMIENSCLSYYYSLPNKFFQNIQAHTPIIGSNFPEMERLVDKYKIGMVCKPEDPESLASAIVELKSDQNAYSNYKKNLILAARDLCWESEKEILKQAYSEVL